MISEEQKTQALLSQVGLSLADIAHAMGAILENPDKLSLEQLKTGLEMIRSHAEATSERICSHCEYGRVLRKVQDDESLLHLPSLALSDLDENVA